MISFKLDAEEVLNGAEVLDVKALSNAFFDMVKERFGVGSFHAIVDMPTHDAVYMTR